ncbi:5-oxoprolinase [Neocloeon triangulifer]|uniref:5-oxoprolinase n=1 Tax=Neocloeon triangulifer TaxID=2078957 RepID=UPI00286F9A7C|nr:5-oxoprolinase [Neocloeon triangulifer]
MAGSAVETGDKFQFAIDRGGTFTDIYARCPGGKIRVMKLLSVDPANYPDAPREGIRRILEEELGTPFPANKPVNAEKIEWIRMGTTVATNALLERKGERMALVVNEGFKDVLFIGNQARPRIFDLAIKCPDVLYESVVEAQCRVLLEKAECELKFDANLRKVTGSTGEKLIIVQELDEVKLRADLMSLLEVGIQSLAVVFMHSYTFPEHELRVGQLAKQLGFKHVSLSHQVMPMVRLVPRGFTACADGYLTPHIQTYLKGFASGFKDDLKGVNVLFMQSDGGLSPMELFNGSRAILSGPAGGVVGYAMTSWDDTAKQPIIGFDMGGTSTDVSRYAGEYEHVFESTTAGVAIQAPQLDINTVAAGGGSMLFFRSGMLVVGPESAGAHPGPTCYRKGGPLTVTDANLVLGRILPQYFPQIFGPRENEPLDKEGAKDSFIKLTNEINRFSSKEGAGFSTRMSVEDVAMGFIRVANEAMCRPIRALTQARGFDTSQHILACFGGAGGQHACSIARALGMSTVLVHKYAGILSAYGMALASVVQEAQEASAKVYCKENFAFLDERLNYLDNKCRAKLKEQGFSDDQIKVEPYLHMRYRGTDCALMCHASSGDSESGNMKHGDFLESFLERYKREFGFTIPARDILVDDIRVRATGNIILHNEAEITPAGTSLPIEKTTRVFFETGPQETPVLLLKNLGQGHTINGPAIVIDGLSTILVEPGCIAKVTPQGNIRIQVGSTGKSFVGEQRDPIQLAIFSHRFMSIAEQMGRILQRTSISTNIKERLDFSCALFGPDGGLVSNAPHIPVHLGAMQEAVQFQLRHLGDNLNPGDVILSNHPSAGGSHLPDLTVITPVFHNQSERPVFFVASRGHHADIGGITPGSMPPHSTSLDQEGAAFVSFKLVSKGEFQLEALKKQLVDAGTRNLHDNLADLQAQVAANQRGIQLVLELIDSYGLNVVQAYMAHIQQNAEIAVRDMLKQVAQINGQNSTLSAEDFLDDGSNIKLTVTIDNNKGSAVFDFTGTSYEVWGNANAPRAITLSAIIYCLRCMVAHDVPLNQGCLAPVKIVVPKGSLLDPSENAAVVGGNVTTSQRIVDVIFRAFSTCSASNGCKNNITFGTDTWGYYETVAGGAGAGPSWHGRSGVHTHMTNTRITDPEIVERHYPVVVNHFSLRGGSGGGGRWKGGNGIRRELLFRTTVTLSVLTERRVFQPYGLFGGEDGKRGQNLLIRSDGRIIRLGSKTAVKVNPGETFRLLTPGGGGFGKSDNLSPCQETPVAPSVQTFAERGSVYEYRQTQESS